MRYRNAKAAKGRVSMMKMRKQSVDNTRQIISRWNHFTSSSYQNRNEILGFFKKIISRISCNFFSHISNFYWWKMIHFKNVFINLTAVQYLFTVWIAKQLLQDRFFANWTSQKEGKKEENRFILRDKIVWMVVGIWLVASSLCRHAFGIPSAARMLNWPLNRNLWRIEAFCVARPALVLSLALSDKNIKGVFCSTRLSSERFFAPEMRCSWVALEQKQHLCLSLARIPNAPLTLSVWISTAIHRERARCPRRYWFYSAQQLFCSVYLFALVCLLNYVWRFCRGR